MTLKKRILRFITYYRLLPVKERGVLRRSICEECEFKGGTFDYKMKHLNYSELQLRTIESLIPEHQDGKITVL